MEAEVPALRSLPNTLKRPLSTKESSNIDFAREERVGREWSTHKNGFCEVENDFLLRDLCGKHSVVLFPANVILMRKRLKFCDRDSGAGLTRIKLSSTHPASI